MDLATIKLIATILDIADAVAEIATKFQGNQAMIRQLIAEDRAPTPEERGTLQAARDANTEIIENA